MAVALRRTLEKGWCRDQKVRGAVNLLCCPGGKLAARKEYLVYNWLCANQWQGSFHFSGVDLYTKLNVAGWLTDWLTDGYYCCLSVAGIISQVLISGIRGCGYSGCRNCHIHRY